MFERYTEKAWRIIFFARYQASESGSPYIETEHLLLGLVREDKGLALRFLPGMEFESLHKQIDAKSPTRKKIAVSVDLPLSNECKRVLAYAAEEAVRLPDKHIGSEHLLLGLLREENSFAAELLRSHGLKLDTLRKGIQGLPRQSGWPLAVWTGPPATLGTNLSELAVEGKLHPVVARDKQLETLIHVLGRSTKKNAVLVGEAGVGKRSIVMGLAQRIVQGRVPRWLEEKAILELDLSQIVRNHQAHTEPLLERLAHDLRTETIFLIDKLHSMLATAPSPSATRATELLKNVLETGRIQCICTALPEDFGKATKDHRWLRRCFRLIEVPPMTEAEAAEVVRSAQPRLETFHSVTFDEEALQSAVEDSNIYVKDRYLPDKALDLLDEAGAYVNASCPNWPLEVIQAQERLKFTTLRLEEAIANHEFERARFYSQEQAKARQELNQLLKKHSAGEAVRKVTGRDVKEVLARWLNVPVRSLEQGEGEVNRGNG